MFRTQSGKSVLLFTHFQFMGVYEFMTANIHSKLFFKNAFSAAQCFPVLLFVI